MTLSVEDQRSSEWYVPWCAIRGRACPVVDRRAGSFAAGSAREGLISSLSNAGREHPTVRWPPEPGRLGQEPEGGPS